MKRLFFLWMVAVVFPLFYSCSEDKTRTADSGRDATLLDVFFDAGESTDTDAGGARWIKPDGYASVTFYVDDSENQTYKDGQMKWNGSFVWDEKTNIAVYASSWLPTDGPFPPLYDDGPISAGGHEMEGAAKGDHIFSTEIYIKPDPERDIIFEYGLINEWNYWIWEGPNGQFTVAKGSDARIDAQGLKFHKFGEIDSIITIDMNAIHPDFKGGAKIENVFIKGSMNSWTPVQILDDGQNGDEKSGDGVYTYLHSKHLGVHDGLLYLDQHVQFVFVFNSEDGIEYKVNGDAVADGVKAYTDYNKKGEFLEEEISLELESRGKSKNTTIIVGRGKGEDAAPVITFVEPDRGPVSGGTNVSIRGKNFKSGAGVYFGRNKGVDVHFLNSSELGVKSPPGSKGSVDVSVTNPDGKTAVFKNGFTYEESPAPKILSVKPDRGVVEGGTAVSINGSDFQSRARVYIGNECSDVQFVSSSELHCKTTAHKKGVVDVVVKNPDGQQDILLGGFTYYEEHPKVDWCNIQWPYELSVIINEESDAIYSQVYEEGVTEGVGRGSGIKSQLGYGNPSDDLLQWKWIDAVYNVDVGNNDEYLGRLQIEVAGPYAFAYRYSMDDGNSWVYCDKDGSENGFSMAQTGRIKVVDKTSNQPKISSINPVKGSTYGGESVEIRGENFQDGIKVYFGSKEGTQIVFNNSSSVAAKTPAHPAGKVDVKVVNPDGLSATLPLAFEFESPAALPQWGRLQWPYTLRAGVNTSTAEIYGRVYHPGVTDSPGQGVGIFAHLGYGPRGSNPSSTEWIWVDAEYNIDDGNNDEYKGTLKVLDPGYYWYTYRFSFDKTNWLYVDIDGSENGLSLAQLGRMAIGDVVDWCNIQWPTKFTGVVGTSNNIYSQVYLEGVTDQIGQGSDIMVEILTSDELPVSPERGIASPAVFNKDYGNNDEYVGSVIFNNVGTFYYWFRVKYKNGPWIYCDVSGTDDGFTPTDVGVATIQ